MFGQFLRVGLIVLGVCASLASSRQSGPPPVHPSAIPGAETGAPPASQSMDPNLIVGLWHSSFGPVKIEYVEPTDQTRVHGVWVYDRENQEVIGSFEGAMQGNVLEFQWHEPGQPAPLEGNGYLVFDPNGMSFRGRWWTNARERSGEWDGWRSDPMIGRQPKAQAEAP